MSKTTFTIATFATLLLFYIFCINRVGLNEYGVAYNKANGQMELQGSGWHLTTPSVKVSLVQDYPLAIDLSDVTSVNGVRGFIPKFVKLKIKKEYVFDFFNDIGFKYMQPFEQMSYLKQAYYQDVKPKWLEVLEK